MTENEMRNELPCALLTHFTSIILYRSIHTFPSSLCCLQYTYLYPQTIFSYSLLSSMNIHISIKSYLFPHIHSSTFVFSHILSFSILCLKFVFLFNITQIYQIRVEQKLNKKQNLNRSTTGE